MATHYQLLGIKPAATADEVRLAYRKLIRKYHPDVAGAAGEAKTRQLNEAQRILSSQTLRSEYDRLIRPPEPALQDSQPAASPGPMDFGTNKNQPRAPTRVAYTPGPEYEAAQEQAFLWSRSRYLFWRNTWLISLLVLLLAAFPPIAFFFNGFSVLRALPGVLAVAVIVVAFSSGLPRIATVLAFVGALLWPLGEMGIWPAAGLLKEIPAGYLASLTALGVAAVVFRVSAGPARSYWKSRPYKNRDRS